MSTASMLSPRGSQQAKTTQTQVVESSTLGEHIEYAAPKPRTAFSAFVDHPDQFIVFLEACIATEGLKAEDKADLHTTLFEIYLHKASTTKAEEKADWEKKAKTLLEDKNVPIDTSDVLLLSDLEKFRDGTVLVSEKHGLFFDVFRSYTTAKDTAGAIKALRKYGPEEPQLYPAALAYFTSSPQILEEAGPEIDSVLKRIDEDSLMAPLQVIQTLSLNSVATMGLVKRYLSLTVARERAETAANRRMITSYRADTQQKLKDTEELATRPLSFSATRCSTCGATLELPTVHFMCKHSFHQRCLNIPEGWDVSRAPEIECPLCAPQNAIVRQTREAQEESASRHELFLASLKQSERDRFGVLGEWYGRGVLSAVGVQKVGE